MKSGRIIIIGTMVLLCACSTPKQVTRQATYEQRLEPKKEKKILLPSSVSKRGVEVDGVSTKANASPYDGFVVPHPGKKISDYGMRNGRMHTGVDIKGAPGDTIRAAWRGTVKLSRPYYGYGNMVTLSHLNGYETSYAHNSKNLVSEGDVVEAGDPIALMGRTGRATTEHIHFEISHRGNRIDPNSVIDFDTWTLRQTGEGQGHRPF